MVEFVAKFDRLNTIVYKYDHMRFNLACVLKFCRKWLNLIRGICSVVFSLVYPPISLNSQDSCLPGDLVVIQNEYDDEIAALVEDPPSSLNYQDSGL